MKKKVAALVLLLVAAYGSYWGYTRHTAGQNVGIQASGTIEATDVNLTARTPGAIEFISVRPGEKVSKGQLVAKVTRNDLAAQKERDALAVQKAGAQLSDLVSGAREQEISDAKAALNTARANFDKAGSDLARAKTLHQSGAIPEAELEKADTVLKVAANQLESARSRLSLLESGARPDQIKAAEIELEKSKAVLKATESLLEDANITSPLDGTVVTRNYEPGEFVQAGAPVITVADLSDMWIRIYVSTDDLPAVKLGQEVGFTVSGVSETFKGTVTEIASGGEFTPKSIQTKQERTNTVYAVKVGIDNSKGMFKPGMPADVTIAN